MIEFISIDNNNIKDNILLSNNTLLSGNKATVKLEFIVKPEYVKVGMQLIFREGKVKAVGKIMEI